MASAIRCVVAGVALLLVAACESSPPPVPTVPPADPPNASTYVVREIIQRLSPGGWPSAVCYDLHYWGKLLYVGTQGFESQRRASADVFVKFGLLKPVERPVVPHSSSPPPDQSIWFEITDRGRQYMGSGDMCFGQASEPKVTAMEAPSFWAGEWGRKVHYTITISGMPDFTQDSAFRDVLHPPANGQMEREVYVRWLGDGWGFPELHMMET